MNFSFVREEWWFINDECNAKIRKKDRPVKSTPHTCHFLYFMIIYNALQIRLQSRVPTVSHSTNYSESIRAPWFEMELQL